MGSNRGSNRGSVMMGKNYFIELSCVMNELERELLAHGDPRLSEVIKIKDKAYELLKEALNEAWGEGFNQAKDLYCKD